MPPDDDLVDSRPVLPKSRMESHVAWVFGFWIGVASVAGAFFLPHVALATQIAICTATPAATLGALFWWRRAPRPTALRVAGAVPLVAGLGSAAAWRSNHERLWIDNPSPHAVTVSVDGERVATVSAGAKASVDVYSDVEHELSWRDDAGHEGSTRASLRHTALLNPGATGCYAIEHASYSDGQSSGAIVMPQSPTMALPVQAFHAPAPADVDHWLEALPDSIEVKRGVGLGVAGRSALVRDSRCLDLATCPLPVRAKLSDCLREAGDTKEAIAACRSTARVACPDRI